MKQVKSEDIKVGMGIKTWFGTHTVTAIKPYTGTFDFILNLLEFSNGSSMSNEKGMVYEALDYNNYKTTLDITDHFDDMWEDRLNR